MSSDVVISVSGLCKSYETYNTPRDRFKQLVIPPLQKVLGMSPSYYADRFHALSDVGFEVRQGETFGIVGRNGSGKSTLLQILCGTLTPTAGTVKVHGKVAALLELGAGFNPEFSGRENVFMNGLLFGLTNEQIEQRFDRIAAFADIGSFIDKPVKTYSSGMYVRLAFAVIAHVDADILIVDEALSVGDAYFVQKCMRFLREFMEKGTLLFVSHDIGAVQNLCSRALWLEKGVQRELGEPKEVIKHYLEGLVAEKQDVDAVKQEEPLPDLAANDDKGDIVDMRDRFLNGSSLRNDIELFHFDTSGESFGAGGARLLDVRMEDPLTDKRLAWVVGGEVVRLVVRAQALEHLDSIILGFDLKDRLGQTVFGDNTFLTYRTDPQSVAQNGCVEAVFEFRMPVLRAGDYAITAAVATGTQEKHVQRHWMHEAMILRSQPSRVCFGAVGLPMRKIEIRKA